VRLLAAGDEQHLAIETRPERSSPGLMTARSRAAFPRVRRQRSRRAELARHGHQPPGEKDCRMGDG
jgi:hypothetical protein